MFNERDHPRDRMGQFAEKDMSEQAKRTEAIKKYSDDPKRDMEKLGVTKKKLSPEEKIARVHIDFLKDNVLPELNESELKKIGVKKNKAILLKKGVIDRNRFEHDDLTDEDFERIVANALYSPSEVFKANKDRPYFHFAKIIEVNSKGKPEIGLALLDVDDKKDNFEIVHAHFIGRKALERAKKKD